MNPIIESIYNESLDIINKLNDISEISLAIDAKRNFTKIFILSAASFFEDQIQKIIIEFVKISSNNNDEVICFLKNKAIAYNYHTYFAWGEKGQPDKFGKNANAFFSLFGEDFKNKINKIILTRPELGISIKCFLEIGHMRNILIHSNFAAYNNISKTIEEFKDMFIEADKFIIFLEEILLKK